MKTVAILPLFLIIFFFNNSNLLSASIYRWVDENGVKNFSNFPATVPISVFEDRSVKVSDRYISNLPLYNSSIDKAQDNIEKEFIAKIEKQLERQLLVNKYKELEDRDDYLKEQLTVKKNSALKTKREFDNLIIKGYFSDHSILELKRLQREMKKITAELNTIEPKKRKIVSFAGQRGISNRYFKN